MTSHLQRIQNYAARVILRLPKSSSITIHLKSLHWLPVKVRSTYKIACLCYHCHSSTAPSFVTGMLHRKPLHTRNTRSSSYTMPLSIDLHTVRQHLVIVHFILLLILSGALCQMMSGVPHHCHHIVSFEDILVSFSLQRLNCILDHCTYVHDLALLLLC